MTNMTDKPATPERAIPRRHFLLSTCLATTALGLKPLTGMGARRRKTLPGRTLRGNCACGLTGRQ